MELQIRYIYIESEGRLYDPNIASFFSPDPFVVDATSTQAFNRYSYCLNNPLMYTDPSGEFPWLAIAIGAAVNWTMNGFFTRSDGSLGWKANWNWKGLGDAAIGGLAGGLGTIGGGSLLANVAWGAGQGALIGGLQSVNNAGKFTWSIFGEGAMWGAISGAAFAGITSGYEAYDNYKDGYGFKTNYSVEKGLYNAGDKEGLVNFISDRYGMSDVSMRYDASLKAAYGEADPITGNITIAPAAFESVDMLKATMIHEYAHSSLDRMLDASGNFIGWRYPIGSYSSTNSILVTDGPLGYANEIFNAGKLHIGPSVLKPNYNPLWSEWNRGVKWYNLIPRRFNNKVSLFMY